MSSRTRRRTAPAAHRALRISPCRIASLLRRFAVVVAFAAGNLASQTTLSVLTDNIQRGVGSASSVVDAQPALAEVVNQLNPDVWTINELGGIAPGFSRSAAYGYADAFVASYLTIFGTSPKRDLDYFVAIGTYQDGYSTNAIISRYPILEAQSYSDAGDGYSVLRGLSYAMIDVPNASDVGVFTMHLKSSSDTDSATRRQAEAETNRETISGWMSLHPSLGVVVTGDWNASRDSDDPSNWGTHNVGDTVMLVTVGLGFAFIAMRRNA
jgi:endonuclease/exonuclease/phosphatase family metal-dependent hydrolase